MGIPSRRGVNLVVAIGILAASLFTGGEAAARQMSHAGVVVQHGDLGTLTDCVAFTERRIDGVKLLERSSFEYRAARFPDGTGICWIDGEGCKTRKAEDCFCTPLSGAMRSWSYWVQEHDDAAFDHGETYPSGRVIRDGSIDYWTFGPHAMPPTELFTIEDICGTTHADAAGHIGSVDRAVEVPRLATVHPTSQKRCSGVERETL